MAFNVFKNTHNSKNICHNQLTLFTKHKVSENVIKTESDFEAIFWKKPWAIIIAHGIFQKLANFF